MRTFLIAIGTLAAGCTLSSSHGGGGDNPGPGPDPVGGPVGHTFVADRATDSASPCPSFDRENATHQIAVQATAVLVDAQPASAVSVTNVAADESSTPPNVLFGIDEIWSSAEGTAQAHVSYTLWADSTSASGQAQTSFVFDGTTATSCSYTWTVTAF
jgi:hypothetical protein